MTTRPFRTDGIYRGLPALRRNLRTLVVLARSAGAGAVFVTHPFLPTEPGWDRAMEDTAKAIREVASEEGVPVADALEEIRDPTLFRPLDPLHLLPEGEHRIAELVLRAIEATGRLGP